MVDVRDFDPRVLIETISLDCVAVKFTWALVHVQIILTVPGVEI